MQALSVRYIVRPACLENPQPPVTPLHALPIGDPSVLCQYAGLRVPRSAVGCFGRQFRSTQSKGGSKELSHTKVAPQHIGARRYNGAVTAQASRIQESVRPLAVLVHSGCSHCERSIHKSGFKVRGSGRKLLIIITVVRFITPVYRAEC